VFRLAGVTPRQGETITVVLPVKTRDILYQLPLGIAAVLFLASWPGLRSRATIRALWWRPLALAVASVGIALVGLLGLYLARGPAVWLAILVLFIGPLIAAAILLGAEARARERDSLSREALIGAALLLGVVLGACALAEAYLGWQSADPGDARPVAATANESWFQLPEDVVRLANARAGVLTLPDEWRRRDETVEGATSAYVWHGALHLHDEWGFRRLNGPFPAKDPETLRIMVVGDSMTYGYGVDEQWTFSRLLEGSLQASYRVEVVNLGRSGFQSEDILGVLQKFLPLLEPDLVMYVVCLNDFLPSGERLQDAYVFPFPETWKEYLWERTRLVRLFDDAYRSLLLRLDVTWDFFDEILAGDKTCQARFTRDVAAMNHRVLERGLPPITGIVFDHSPGGDPRAWHLIEIAEQAMEDAGFDVISVLPWRERFRKRRFPVSRWESHPNELAHSLIAEQLSERLLANGKLEDHRIRGH
jgi:hypothetical protein